ncbi:nif11-like leader peptide domain protein [Synechococcus sp. BIOS-E4-1]|uniref:Nif11-like leader peptide family natural product precursor n=1 Tax=Synechococcus sp. BIOS-E4-1 TaxID=1400864 RepID=UPI0016455078|nr:Nif11-like leader peptide family natural product precursor [Synechococcus sp. BIOS-E4-1]QNI54181.1 nif11-like leader peptide domain protein [Synechococcus sp. BIOS-E4-1]
MSEEQLKSFLEKVKADTTLQEKLKAAADADAALAIAKEAGFAITAEDIQSMQSATDLSDAELERVAGGGGWYPYYTDADSCTRCTCHRNCG